MHYYNKQINRTSGGYMILTVLMYVCLLTALVAAVIKLKTVFRVSLVSGVLLSALIAGLSGGGLDFFYEIGGFALIAVFIAFSIAVVEHIHAGWVFRNMSIPRTSQLKTLKGRCQVFYVTFTKYLKHFWLAG